MIRLPLAATALIALIACSPSYEGTVQVTIGPELATTTDRLLVSVELNRFADDVRFVISRDGAEFKRLSRLDDEVTTDRFMIEGNRYSFSIPAEETAKGQVWTIEVIVVVGKSETSSTGTITIGNTPPTATVSLSPDAPRIIDTLVATGVGADIDGDPTTVSYKWFVNDQAVGATGPEFDPSTTVRGDIVRVEATANDGTDDSAPATAQATIRNTAPTAFVALTPESPNTTDLLIAVATGTDPDGDPLTFEYGWTVNGEVVAGLSPEFPPQRTVRGDVITVTVVARDGRTVSPAVSDQVVIGNSPPGRADIAIAQSPSGPERDLHCKILAPAPEPDRDPVTYAFTWERNGEPWTGPSYTTTLTGDTISTASTRIGEVWTCKVVASDGDLSGPAATATSEIVRWTGTRTFTNCRATRQNGPSQEQCDTAYAPTPLQGEVELVEGIQLWVVPVTGAYRITAHGAAGENGDDGYGSPKGAKIVGTFDLVQGEMLQIAVGQRGAINGFYSGGGGGTWVMSETDAPLVIAGGGGGVATYSWGAGCGGRSTNAAGAGSGIGTSMSCPVKTSGVGLGGAGGTSNSGSGGGGLNSDGTSTAGTVGSGKSWRNGLKGGGDSSFTAYGGFGGGAAGNGSYSYGAGGGGGYSGGDGGRVAGGGGSFNAGRSQTNTANENDGAGKVLIELLD
jgi:hypothetical protein